MICLNLEELPKEQRIDLNVSYDSVQERILEEAISCLFETIRAIGTMEEKIGSSEFMEVLEKKSSVLLKSRKEEIYHGEDYKYENFFNFVTKLLEDRGFAIRTLFNLNNINFRSFPICHYHHLHTLNNLLKCIVCPKEMRVLFITPAGLCLSLLVGYCINIDLGITSGLRNANQKLYDMVFNVWEHAIEELHPFQRGPTHQGTKHCIQVVHNLNILKKSLNIISLPLEVWAMLHIAAALHDIGKGDLIAKAGGKKHAANAAMMIEDHAQDLKLDNDCKSFVAKIVKTHNPENPLQEIDKLTPFNIVAPNVNIDVKGVETKKVCALFQLADVLDINKDRVSSVVFKMHEKLYSKSNNSDESEAFKGIKKVVNARCGIVNWRIITGVDKHIKITKSSNTSFHDAIKERIQDDNKDLKKTGAKKVLQDKGWPYELKE